ncbi:MAG TPA: hypothetical protein VI197_16155 [Polyangiaceae bacterium]
MSKKSSGTSEGAGEGVERPEDADVKNEEQAQGKGASEDGDASEDVADEAEARPAAKRTDRDEADDDDDDDDDDDEEKPRSKPAPANQRAGRVPTKADSARSPTARSRAAKAADSIAPLSEAEIDSPSKQTLGMLGVVAAATLVMWGVGRAECNYNEVGEGMKPREVSIDERTRTPKDLAFAFEYALSSYDFATARKLSTGEAKKLVEERERACKGGGGCDEKRKLLKPKVASVAELLKRTASHALTRVWSEGGENAKKHVAVLKREGRGWLVESYRPDTGAPVELPGDVAPPIPEHASTAPAPTASGLVPGAASAMPPGHPPVPGYGLDPRRGLEGAARAPGTGASKPPTPGVRSPVHGVRPTAPAPGAAQPAPLPGAAKPPTPAP